MKPNRVRRQLLRGETALGTMVFEFATTGIARIAAAAGAEFVLFDLEHTGWSLETLRMLVATCGGADIVPLARVPATEYHFMARALDVGVMGLMVPMVESVEQAQTIIRSTKYRPQGRRGVALQVAHDEYRAGDPIEKMRSANEETLLIAQIESECGVEQVDGIAAVDGIDVLWIGQFDLTNSMGIPCQFDHPRYREAVSKVLAACATHGKAAGFMAATPEQGNDLLRQGFRIVALGGDLWLYQQALQSGLAALRQLSAPASG